MIDVKKLGKDAYVFDAGRIANMLTLDMYRGAQRSVNDEFLVAWRVPEDAIVRTDIVRHPNHGEVPLYLVEIVWMGLTAPRTAQLLRDSPQKPVRWPPGARGGR